MSISVCLFKNHLLVLSYFSYCFYVPYFIYFCSHLYYFLLVITLILICYYSFSFFGCNLWSLRYFFSFNLDVYYYKLPSWILFLYILHVYVYCVSIFVLWRYFLISLLISSLIQWLFKIVLFHFHVSVNFSFFFHYLFIFFPTMVRKDTWNDFNFKHIKICFVTWNVICPEEECLWRMCILLLLSGMLCRYLKSIWTQIIQALSLLILNFNYLYWVFVTYFLSEWSIHYCKWNINISFYSWFAIYFSLQICQCLVYIFKWAIIGCIYVFVSVISCWIDSFIKMMKWPSSL